MTASWAPNFILFFGVFMILVYAATVRCMGNDACRNSRGRAGASEVKSYQTDAETKQVWGVVYIFLSMACRQSLPTEIH